MLNANDIYTLVLAFLGSGTATALAHKVFGPKAVAIEKKAVEVAKEAQPLVMEGVHAVEELLKLPAVAPLRLKLLEEKKKFEESELARITAATLHGFGKAFNDLTENEKLTLVSFVRAEMAKMNIEVSAQAITRACHVIEALSDGFKSSDIFKHTAELEKSRQELENPAVMNTPTETEQTTQQPAGA